MTRAAGGCVLVGLDASGGTAGDRALDWAIDDALARHARLQIVAAWHRPTHFPWPGAHGHRVEQELRSAARRSADRGRRRARRAGSTAVTTMSRQGELADVLTPLSGDADVVVIGGRRPPVLDAAHCPVVLVPGTASPAQHPRHVVIGLAGTAHDNDLLAFGFDHARRHEARVRAIFCWDPVFGDLTLPPPRLVRSRMAGTVELWQEQFPDVVTEFVGVRGDPVEVLLANAAPQDLLVIGRHAHRGRVGALLGSTGLALMHHTHCPIAILPTPVSRPGDLDGPVQSTGTDA